jgi:hypothetical protein
MCAYSQECREQKKNKIENVRKDRGKKKGKERKVFAVLLHIRDIPGSNLGPDISRSFRQFHQAIPV